MKPARSVVLTKRDGTLERFSLEKLRSCLARVLRQTADSPRLADPLARAIAIHLRGADPRETLSSEYVHRCVRAVLRQTGLSDAAQTLAAHRRLRQARRRRVRVYDPLESAGEPLRWRKGAIVATLQNVYDLRQAVARFLAGRIEDRVLGLGYRLLSKQFLAELVRNEVLAWGLLTEPVTSPLADAATPRSLAGRQPPKEE